MKYSNFTSDVELDILRYDCCAKKKKSTSHRSRRHYRFSKHPACTRNLSGSGLEVLVLVSERYQKDVYYPSYSLTHHLQRYDDGLASEIQKSR